MKKVPVVCAAALGALLLLAPSAYAQQFTMVANLTGGEEVPPVASGAFGNAEVTVDVGLKTVKVDLTVYNLGTGSTAGHIHAGAKGAAGPVVINFSFPPGRTGDFHLIFNLTTADFIARPDQGILVWDDIIQAIQAGNAYVNVHTTLSPGGEIRGQLSPKP